MKKSNRCLAVEQKLLDAYEHWNSIYINGEEDPFWNDGYHLNVVRKHIIHLKNELKTLGYFPAIYHKELPPLSEATYMARPDEIRANAKQVVEQIRKDKNYQYISSHYHLLDNESIKTLNVRYSYMYPVWLEDFIEKDDLISMRRQGRKDPTLFQIFKDASERIREHLKKEEFAARQLTLFDFIS